MKRIELANCSSKELDECEKDRSGKVTRLMLIFAAGALDNWKVLADLGSYERSVYFEGKRAANKDFKSPYFE